MLNANVQDEQNAIQGQGSGNIELKSRRLKDSKVNTPDVISQSIKEIPSLYARIITPEDMETSRIVLQLTGSEAPSIPISTQINNKINPTMENSTVKGGTRQSI